MIFRFLIAVLLAPAFATAQPGDPQLRFPSVDELPEVVELPNPFVFLDGTEVKSRKDWDRRREEMKAMVLHYQFGHAPALPAPDRIEAEILSETDVIDEQAVKRAVRLRFGPGNAVSLSLRIHVPKGRLKGVRPLCLVIGLW